MNTYPQTLDYIFDITKFIVISKNKPTIKTEATHFTEMKLLQRFESTPTYMYSTSQTRKQQDSEMKEVIQN